MARLEPTRPAVVHRSECACAGCKMARSRGSAAMQRGPDYVDPADWRNPWQVVERDPKTARRVIVLCLIGCAILLALLRWLAIESG